MASAPKKKFNTENRVAVIVPKLGLKSQKKLIDFYGRCDSPANVAYAPLASPVQIIMAELYRVYFATRAGDLVGESLRADRFELENDDEADGEQKGVVTGYLHRYTVDGHEYVQKIGAVFRAANARYRDDLFERVGLGHLLRSLSNDGLDRIFKGAGEAFTKWIKQVENIEQKLAQLDPAARATYFKPDPPYERPNPRTGEIETVYPKLTSEKSREQGQITRFETLQQLYRDNRLRETTPEGAFVWIPAWNDKLSLRGLVSQELWHYETDPTKDQIMNEHGKLRLVAGDGVVLSRACNVILNRTLDRRFIRFSKYFDNNQTDPKAFMLEVPFSEHEKKLRREGFVPANSIDIHVRQFEERALDRHGKRVLVKKSRLELRFSYKKDLDPEVIPDGFAIGIDRGSANFNVYTSDGMSDHDLREQYFIQNRTNRSISETVVVQQEKYDTYQGVRTRVCTYVVNRSDRRDRDGNPLPDLPIPEGVLVKRYDRFTGDTTRQEEDQKTRLKRKRRQETNRYRVRLESPATREARSVYQKRTGLPLRVRKRAMSRASAPSNTFHHNVVRAEIGEKRNFRDISLVLNQPGKPISVVMVEDLKNLGTKGSETSQHWKKQQFIDSLEMVANGRGIVVQTIAPQRTSIVDSWLTEYDGEKIGNNALGLPNFKPLEVATLARQEAELKAIEDAKPKQRAPRKPKAETGEKKAREKKKKPPFLRRKGIHYFSGENKVVMSADHNGARNILFKKVEAIIKSDATTRRKAEEKGEAVKPTPATRIVERMRDKKILPLL